MEGGRKAAKVFRRGNVERSESGRIAGQVDVEELKVVEL